MIVTRIIGAAALLSSLATALPHRRQDSAINEPAVSAPDGTPITEGTQPTQTADNAAVATTSSAEAVVESSTSSSVEWESSTTAQLSTATTIAWNSYQTPTYGSGSSNWGGWGGSNYNDCVSQCLASYGNTPQPWTPPAETPESVGSVGSGKTHTVIVAPMQGVLRYVPWAVNASVGDTIKFVWGANNHTVTKSSSLTPCNKTSDAPFASGIQLQNFTFTQVVNDTNPTYFYCAIPTHCQKGMFGVINPPSNSGAASSVSLMMSSWTSSNPDLAAYASYADSMTQNNTVASRWGGNIDVASMPEYTHEMVAENTMYTRTFLAANPEIMGADGSIDMANAGTTPLMFPQDFMSALNNAGASAPGAPSSAVSAPSSAATESASTTPAANANITNGASAASPQFIVALVAAAASLFLL